MKYYLAYGMNTNIDGMANRCPLAISHGKVTLPDHTLAFRGVCDIVKTPGKNMECVLWTITESCEKSLDALEGYPHMYDKKYVTVNYMGKNILAMVYYMVNTNRLDLPSEYYLRMVAEGYRDHNIDVLQIPRALKEVMKPDRGNDEYYFRNRGRRKAKRKLHSSRVRNF